jgi:uncharacterized protein DUF4381
MRRFFIWSWLIFVPNLVIAQAELPEPAPLIEPEPVAFSFNTPGWYMIGGLLALSIFFLSYRWYKKYRANAYRRQALRQLNEIENQLDSGVPGINKVLVLLKATAIKVYGRLEVGPLSGREWLNYLDTKGQGTSFSSLETTIDKMLYNSQAPDNVEQVKLIEQSKRWIKTHA